MYLKNITSYNSFKELKKLNENIDLLLEDSLPRDYASNKTNFSTSLLGRSVNSLFKFLKRSVDLVKLEFFRRKFENELAMGVLRTYAKSIDEESPNEEMENQEGQKNEKDVKALPSHDVKALPSHGEQRKITYGDYKLILYNNSVAVKDEKWLMYINKSEVVYYDSINNKVIKEVPITEINDIESLNRILDIIISAVSNNKIKLGIKEDDITQMITNLKSKILNDNGLTDKITKLFQIIYKVRKSNSDDNLYKNLYDLTKKIASESRNKGMNESIILNENFNYNNWILVSEGINNLIGFKKIIGETKSDLDWEKLKGKNATDMMKKFQSSKELRDLATHNTNKDAIAAIQYAVQSAIQHTESPDSTKLFPGEGGGISNKETYLARIWKKMVSNVLGEFKFFLNTEELNPYNLVKNIKPDNDNIENLKKSVEKSTTDVNHKQIVYNYINNPGANKDDNNVKAILVERKMKDDKYRFYYFKHSDVNNINMDVVFNYVYFIKNSELEIADKIVESTESYYKFPEGENLKSGNTYEKLKKNKLKTLKKLVDTYSNNKYNSDFEISHIYHIYDDNITKKIQGIKK